MWWLYVILAVSLVIFALILIVLIRAINFNPIYEEPETFSSIDFDKNAYIESFSKLIQIKTVSCTDKNKEDEQEFIKFNNLLPVLFPKVYENCQLSTFDGKGLLFKWQGKSDKSPSVLMSHYDVVEADESAWEKPPFSAVIENGEIWGRGTVDTKITFNAILFAVNKLISDGFIPENDIYLAFSGTEEINGDGAKNIVKYFKENNIPIQLVLDEGGAVVSNVFPGVKGACGLIGIAEKGYMNVSYTVNSNGGHASAPNPNSPLVTLSKACLKVENKPFKYHLSKPVKELFDTLGRHSTFIYKIIFANLWLFKGVINKMAIKSGGNMNALIRTTVAFTQIEGSQGANVIPNKATMVSNIRISPIDTPETVLAQVRNTVNDENVIINEICAQNPSRISKTNCNEFDKIKSTIKGTWGNEVLVAPYLMVQCSDSRHYGEISDKVYRFSAMDLTDEERNGIHGNNEKIRVETAYKTAEFYLRLINTL